MAEALMFGPPLFLGLIIGFYEIIIIHRDITIPTHRFGHGIHAMVLSLIFTFATMNAEFVLSVIPALAKIPILGTPLGLHIALGLLAAIKIHGVSRVIQTTGIAGRGLAETWFHCILIGALIAATPYIYPIVKPMLPKWATSW